MSADKTTAKIGTLLIGDEERDAIHIAVAPSVADHRLHPGAHVGLTPEGAASAFAENLCGIVDPYLRTAIEPGSRFFIFLYPGSITSLRHDWTHPAFVNEPLKMPEDLKATSEAWLREFVKTADCPSYDVLIAAAAEQPIPTQIGFGEGELRYENDGEYLTFYGTDAHGNIPPEFWHHVQIVTGKSIPPTNQAKYFSCSC